MRNWFAQSGGIITQPPTESPLEPVIGPGFGQGSVGVFSAK